MNIAATVIPDRDDAVAALDTLRAWARKASTAEIETLDPSLARLLQSAESYPQFSRDYRKLFGAPPGRDKAVMRSSVAIESDV